VKKSKTQLLKELQESQQRILELEKAEEEREKAKQTANETIELFRELVEKTNIAILIDNKDTTIKYCNKQYAELFGYSHEEMKKQSMKSIIHKEDLKRVLKYHNDRVQGRNAPSRYECRGIKKDGTIIDIEINTVAARNGAGICGTRSYIWDISKRKKREEALRISEEKFRTMLDNTNDAIFIHDLKGSILEVNQIACNRLGYTRKDLLRKSMKELLSSNSGAKNPVQIHELNKNGQKLIETAQVDKKGFTIPIELSSRIIEYEGKSVALSTARDITDRKKAEEDRKEIFEQLKRAMEKTIDALVSAVETRDPFTAGHQQRVTQLAIAIALTLDLSSDQVNAIRMAGIVHDIGKIHVPAEILCKPSRLSEIEFSLLKTHPQVGFDILEKIEFPYSVAQIVLQHHERINGSGYPRSLTEKDILPEAKILMVADVVEAMFSHRPYRPALGKEMAILEITRNKGTLYDPAAVDACLKVFEDGNFKFK
jgi:PAS domain S-box-containing protein/putative nucleotidyltransferase with HDIG domain